MLFLTVKEVAAGGWSKEVYEVGPRTLGDRRSTQRPQLLPVSAPFSATRDNKVWFAIRALCWGLISSVLRRRPPCR